MGVVKDPEVARRIARAVVSDIALYNAKKVEEGIAKDSLFDLLRDEIDEGRNYYNSRVDPEIARNTNHFNDALIDVLVKPMGRVPSKAW
ncbi:MAG: hypothetical protein HZB63_04920 [Deltaproteobacteria bacterium]|nr:hypothetical protein [Deltaproteobacteria bacterium]